MQERLAQRAREPRGARVAALGAPSATSRRPCRPSAPGRGGRSCRRRCRRSSARSPRGARTPSRCPGFAAAPATVCCSSVDARRRSPAPPAAPRSGRRPGPPFARRRRPGRGRRPRRRRRRPRTAPRVPPDTRAAARLRRCSSVSTGLASRTYAAVRARTAIGSAAVQNVHAMREEVRADYEAALAGRAGDDAFAVRFERFFTELRDPLVALYGDDPRFAAAWRRLLEAIASTAAGRSRELRMLDHEREVTPGLAPARAGGRLRDLRRPLRRDAGRRARAAALPARAGRRPTCT